MMHEAFDLALPEMQVDSGAHIASDGLFDDDAPFAAFGGFDIFNIAEAFNPQFSSSFGPFSVLPLAFNMPSGLEDLKKTYNDLCTTVTADAQFPTPIPDHSEPHLAAQPTITPPTPSRNSRKLEDVDPIRRDTNHVYRALPGPTPRIMNQHLERSCHHNRTVYKCTVPSCSAGLMTKSKAYGHVYKHLRRKRFECRCGTQFMSKGAAERHIASQEKLFPCESCGRLFARKDRKNAHQRKCRPLL